LRSIAFDKSESEMRSTDRPDIVRKMLVISILFAAAGMIALFGSANSSFGSTDLRQNPTVPPSPPFVSLIPDNLDFGNQVVNISSKAKIITVKNTGGKPLYFDSVTLSGDNPTAFAILKDTCSGATVDPDKACIVSVTFTPLRTGGRNARLKFNDNVLDSPQRLKLKGNGINSNDVPPF
jgi:HYDIN/CFA65/VesB-like, Ig-like domain